jgi:hypothetical protein
VIRKHICLHPSKRLRRVRRWSEGESELLVTKISCTCLAHEDGEGVERSERAAVLELPFEADIYVRKVRELVSTPSDSKGASFIGTCAFSPKKTETDEKSVIDALDG